MVLSIVRQLIGRVGGLFRPTPALLTVTNNSGVPVSVIVDNGDIELSIPAGISVSPQWHGSFLSEDQIVVDILGKVRADPEAVKRWTDPRSWGMPEYIVTGRRVDRDPNEPDYAGCLMFASMNIRNWYGLWHPENPYTIHDDAPDGLKHPDNFSGRVIDRVRAELLQ